MLIWYALWNFVLDMLYKTIKVIFYPILNLILHYLTQGGIPLIITSFQKLNRQKCRKDSNIWFWYPVLFQTQTIILFCNADNKKSSWYVLNRTTVIYIFTCVQYKKYKISIGRSKKGRGRETLQYTLD